MTKKICVIIFGILFMTESIAKTYYFGPEKQILPPANMLEDEAELSRLYTYFTKDKVVNVFGRSDTYKSPLTATMQVAQLDPNRLKINVEIKNQSGFDWYIPRFDKRSRYSDRKIIFIGMDGYNITSYPRWIPDNFNRSGSTARPVIKRGFDMFAKFSDNSIYNLTYIIDIPKNKGKNFNFNIIFQDLSVPFQLNNKYGKDHPTRLISMAYHANFVKASCKAINDDVENGFTCGFTDISSMDD